MSSRERTVLIAALAVAGLYLFDKVALSPWLERYEKLGTSIYEKEKALSDAETLLTLESEVRGRWKKLEERLNSPERAATAEGLLVHMGELENRAGVSTNVKFSREEQKGDFKEIGIELSLQPSIEGLRNLLIELYNTGEFLKVSRLAVVSTLEDRTRGDRLDVDLKVSTVDFHPLKNGRRKP